MYNRVLFIAPSDSGLDVTPEIDTLADAFTVRVLQGEVGAQRIFEVARRAVWDILHFSCHTRDNSLLLSAGEQFNVESILQIARMCNVKLIFLNACNTATLGQVLVDEGISSVIATLVAVDDRIAKQTALTFYQCLARGMKPFEAFRLARPVRGIYQFLVGYDHAEEKISEVLRRLEHFIEINECDHNAFRDDINRITRVIELIYAQRREFVRVLVLSIISAITVVSFIIYILLTWIK